MATYQPEDIIRDRYKIVKVLGKGGVAITYEAIDTETNQQVAIKVISLQQLDNWKQVELFAREAEVLKQLNHPQIPKYIDYFDIETATDKSFYIVQEIAPGKSLAELVSNGWRSSEAEVKNIAQQILEILNYLHSLEPPVIHRDIKPNNIIRADGGKIYLVDFGAVQHTYYDTLMKGSTVVGTYGYMSPEQFRGKAVPATDLYSLGATILFLLTHRSPAELPQDTLKLNFRSAVNISEPFADWLEKILEPDLEDRYASADAVLKELSTANQIKQRNIFQSIGVAAMCLALAWGFTSYKWFFLSRLGFEPNYLCSFDVETEYYLSYFIEQGGRYDLISKSKLVDILACAIRHQDTETLYEILLSLQPEDRKKLVNNQSLTNNNEMFALKNYKNRTNRGVLFHEAIIYGNFRSIEILIDYGANLEIKDKFGRYPLSLAIGRQNIQIMHLLIAKGANPDTIINTTEHEKLSRYMTLFPENRHIEKSYEYNSLYRTFQIINDYENFDNKATKELFGRFVQENNFKTYKLLKHETN